MKEFFDFKSIYFRFASLVLIAIMSCSIFLTSLYVFFKNRTYWKNQTVILQQIAKSLEENIKYYLPLNKKQKLKNIFKTYIGIAGINNIALFKGDQLIVSVKDLPHKKAIINCKENKLVWHNDHLHFKVNFTINIPKTENIESLILNPLPQNLHKTQKYSLCFIISGKAVKKEFWSTIFLSIIIGALATLIVSVIALLMIKKITMPLKRATEDLIKIADGKLAEIEENILKSDIKEIQELARAFDKMVTALKNKEEMVRKEIQGYVDELERKNKQLQHTINELKESQEQLIQAEKLAGLGIIVAGIAHEINNPLQVINGYCEILMNKEDDSKKIEQLKRIQDHVLRIKKITESLVEYSKKEKNLAPVSLKEVIQSAIETVSLSERTKAVVFDIDVEVNNSKVLGRKTELQQVFVNLFLNSIQAMKGKGKIIVKAKKKDGFIYIKVKDTGPGIPEEHRKYIFDPFFTTKEPGEGTGLGLNIVYRIIMRHRGYIRVCDNDPGATFEIILQACD